MENDWRLTNQDKYLMNEKLLYKKYKSRSEAWEHEHCEFCMKKIMENCSDIEYCVTKGYCTYDEYHWICEDYFNDFHKNFNWKVTKTDN